MATILLVDDQPFMRNALERALTREGYTVHTAGDGLAALALLDTTPLDLVITDLWMPALDGRALVERIRAQTPHLRLVILSGHVSYDEWGPVLDQADAVLAKPIRMATLFGHLRRLLGEGGQHP